MLLLNNLPRLYQEGLAQGPADADGAHAAGARGIGTKLAPKPRGSGGGGGGPARERATQAASAVCDSLAHGAELCAPPPHARLREEWLGGMHMGALLVELKRSAAKALTLSACPQLGGEGLGALLAPMASAAPLASLVTLRATQCAIDDAFVAPFAAAVAAGELHHLRTLALDRNQLHLAIVPSRPAMRRGAGGSGGTPPRVGTPPAAGSGHALADADHLLAGVGVFPEGGVPPKGVEAAVGRGEPTGPPLGAALARLPFLTDLDLSSNPIADEHAAPFLASLFGPRGAAGADAVIPAPSSLRCLHLGGTEAGDGAAAACAEAMQRGSPPLALRALCLSSAVGSKGAAALAAALPCAPSLRELWLGNRVGDEGVEALMAALRSGERVGLRTLGLGGKARSGVVLRNALTEECVTSLAELPRTDAALSDLRLSHNAAIGAAALVRLLSSLQVCVWHARTCPPCMYTHVHPSCVWPSCGCSRRCRPRARSAACCARCTSTRAAWAGRTCPPFSRPSTRCGASTSSRIASLTDCMLMNPRLHARLARSGVVPP